MAAGTATPARLDELADSVIAGRVRELAPDLARRSAQIEQAGEVPADVIGLLREAGCLRLVVPARFGGADLTLAQAAAVVETLTRADGTLGWLIGQVTLAHSVLAYLPATTAAAIYAGGPDVYAAGAAAAKGRATWIGGAWKVSGRWPLVSGIAHAEWLYLQCAVVRDGEAWPAAGVVPELRTVVMPAAEVRVIPTWRGLGLRGSGSHDAHLVGATCPPQRACDLLGAPGVTSISSCLPVRTQAGLVAAAFMTGTASAALDEITALAVHKRPAFGTRRLAESRRFQEALGESSAALAAARWLLHSQLRVVEEATAAGRQLGEAAQARLLAVGPKVAELACSAVDAAYALGGSTSVSDVSPLQRRLRDARSIAQHATLSPEHYGAAGAALAGAAAAGS